MKKPTWKEIFTIPNIICYVRIAKARAVEEYGIPQEEAEATLRRFDKKRGAYYGMNTARKWRDPRNYDMILDSSTLGIDGCVAAMDALLRKEQLL